MDSRTCAADGCDNSLEGKRKDARYCTVRCRTRVNQRGYRERHPGRWREYAIPKLYGLTLPEYDAIIARGCALCGSTENIHLDHDHTSGRVRDALCVNCNNGLGQFKDDPGLLRAAAKYIERHALIHIPDHIDLDPAIRIVVEQEVTA